MIHKYYNGAPDMTLSYVKNILPMIGNIKEFEVFRDKEESPYWSIVDDEKLEYPFILKDDNDNEFWLYTLCGYSGTGPSTTTKILQLLGIKQDFGICEDGVKHIKQENLKPIHKLNLLIQQDKSVNYSQDIQKSLFMSIIDFRYAYQKNNFIKALKSLGYMQHFIPEYKQLFQNSDAFDGLDVPNFEYYYYTNNIFKFNCEFKDFSSEQIELIVKFLSENNGGKFEKKFDIK